MTTVKTSPRARRVRVAAAALLFALGTTAVVSQSASAATSSFGTYMGASGTVYWFAPVYNHSTGGNISINPSSVPSCGGYVNVGLWSPQTGSQFTNSLQYTYASGSRTFTNSSTGANYIAPVGFSIDARRVGACGNVSPTDPIVWFAGTVTY